MDKTLLYTKIDKIIGDKTPLKKDCGLLCEKECCKGDNKTGMILFPGEETTLETYTKNGITIAVCNGNCARDKRPLSCKLFPFFPYIDDNCRISAVIDSRGYGICPMIENADLIRFNRKFIKSIVKAGKLLYTDEDCRAFIKDIDKQIDEYNDFIKKLK